MICYQCKKRIVNEKTAVGCIVEDYGIDGTPTMNAYLCFDCYTKEEALKIINDARETAFIIADEWDNDEE